MKKLTFSDWLFGFQIVMGLAFGLPQAVRMFHSVQGMTIVLFLCMELFIGFNLVLAINAHREIRKRTTLQTLWIYGFWTVIVTSHLLILMAKGTWTSTDSMMMTVIGTSVLATVAVGRYFGKNIKDATVQGVLALWCKTIPQLYLAYCIYAAHGGNGLAAITVWAGHATVLTRVALLVLTGRQSGWNRNVVGSLISETGNEFSWTVTTALWLMY